MRLVMRSHGEDAEAAVLLAGDCLVAIQTLNEHHGMHWETTVDGLLEREQVTELSGWWSALDRGELEALSSPSTPEEWCPLFQVRGTIWCIGLNFEEHAGDLGANRPEEPASFMRPTNTVSYGNNPIRLPPSSQRVTAEAELGLVMGRHARHVPVDRALEYVAGAVAVLDLTAEDILQRNPRFLTRAKSFDTFFSFGTVLATLDEFPDLDRVEVATVVNGVEVRRNTVDHMLFDPATLVSFHSEVFAWQPGDILSTGTPGAGVIRPGDVVEARVDGLPPLRKIVEG